MKYDVAIIGGGLAGLALSIDLRKRGYSVLVLEKGNYPRHKVCGEYISMESHDYLLRICPALASLQLPQISHFTLSSTGNQTFQTRLDLGGFGISRYVLEDMLFTEAGKLGVVFMLKCKATNSVYNESEAHYTISAGSATVQASLVCNATGRKSNFETRERKTKLTGTHYVGIKYHVRVQRDPRYVEIHNFPGGYCGVSAIEDNQTCLCYIVNAKKLNAVHNSIPELEKVYLYQNSHLKKLFNEATFLFKEPLTISGINFQIKKPATDHSLYLGDAAGSIAPVTGNGMSMALRSAAMLASLADSYIKKAITRQQLLENYTGFWNAGFSYRVRLSRYFQKLSEYPLLTKLCIGLFRPFPGLAGRMIRKSHGELF